MKPAWPLGTYMWQGCPWESRNIRGDQSAPVLKLLLKVQSGLPCHFTWSATGKPSYPSGSVLTPGVREPKPTNLAGPIPGHLISVENSQVPATPHPKLPEQSPGHPYVLTTQRFWHVDCRMKSIVHPAKGGLLCLSWFCFLHLKIVINPVISQEWVRGWNENSIFALSCVPFVRVLMLKAY